MNPLHIFIGGVSFILIGVGFIKKNVCSFDVCKV